MKLKMLPLSLNRRLLPSLGDLARIFVGLHHSGSVDISVVAPVVKGSEFIAIQWLRLERKETPWHTG